MAIPGFGSGSARIARFRYLGRRDPNVSGSRTKLMAVANGILHEMSDDGVLTQVSGSRKVASDRPVRGAQWGSKLYLADWGEEVAAGTDLKAGASGVTYLDDVAGTAWSGLSGVNGNDFVIEVTESTDPDVLFDGVFPLTSFGASELQSSSNTNTTTGAERATYSIQRGPKYYDPANSGSGLQHWTANAGTMPVGCPLIEVYRDCVMLAGRPAHQWFLSKQGDPHDWDYTSTDPQGAVAGTRDIKAGTPGRPLTALKAASDNVCLMGTRHRLFGMVGHPRQGGGVLLFSPSVGIVGGDAVCAGEAGEMYFMSAQGLYRLEPGTRNPEPLTRNVVPAEMRDLPSNGVVLGWDQSWGGVHCYVVNEMLGAAAVSHWFWHKGTGSLWKQTLPAGYQPRAMVAIDSTLYVGCSDGYVRYPDEWSGTDDGTAISSTQLIGPFPLGRPAGTEGRIQLIQAVLAENTTGTVTWKLYVGTTADEATAAAIAGGTADASGTWVAGNNYAARPRSRGAAACLRIEGTGQWSMERLEIIRHQAGRQRKG